MRFSMIPNKDLLHAKMVTGSQNFVVCVTGGQAKIFDRNMNLLNTIKNLSHVYNCAISPDEKRLLLVSITNCFYVVSLITFECTKHYIKGKYADNLEGNGCWSLDGNGCYFCVTSKKTLLSALRIYDCIEREEYREVFCDKYKLYSICVVSSLGKLMLTGLNRFNNKSYLIWYDGVTFEEYPINGLMDFDTAYNARYDETNKICVIFGGHSTIICSVDGKYQATIQLPQDESLTFAFSKIFDNVHLTVKEREKISNLSKKLGLEELKVPDSIKDLCISEKGPYLFIATMKKLLCVNMDTQTVEAELNMPFGIQKVQKINENLLMLSTWDSVKIVRITF